MTEIKAIITAVVILALVIAAALYQGHPIVIDAVLAR